MNMFVHLYNLHAVQIMGVLNYGFLFITILLVFV